MVLARERIASFRGELHWYYATTNREPGDEIRDPAVMDDGRMTLMTFVAADDLLAAVVVDRQGRTVQRWDIDVFDLWPDFSYLPETYVPKERPGTHIHGAVVMENGDLVFNFEYIGLLRLSACGDVVWRLARQTHHSVHAADDGTLWVSARTYHEAPVDELPQHVPPIFEEFALQVGPDGRVLKEISINKLLQENGLWGALLLRDEDPNHGSSSVTGDILHLNDVEVFPNDLESGFFVQGDVMVSLRNINTVVIFGQDDRKVRKLLFGEFLRQHDPDFIDEDTISVFDNNNRFQENAKEGGRLVRLGVDGMRELIPTPGPAAFFTDILGKHQQIEDGGVLYSESRKGRAIEIDANGEVVWEYLNYVEPGVIGILEEAQRLPAQMDAGFFERARAACNR